MKTFIVAEVGVAHNGNIETAFKLIDMAKKANVSAVKFQVFFDVPKYNHLRLTKNEFINLFQYATDNDLEWFATPEGYEEMCFLKDQGMRIWKISSAMSRDYGYLQNITQMNPEKIFMSIGGCSSQEINLALQILRYPDIVVSKSTRYVPKVLLHCVPNYPTEYRDVNLRYMVRAKQSFEYPVGLSDHTPGIETSIAAVALGASVIEKHITLDRNQDGPDHSSSIEPNELIDMVRMIRNIEEALGE